MNTEEIPIVPIIVVLWDSCILAMRLKNNDTSCGRFSMCSIVKKARSPRCWRPWSKAENSSRTYPEGRCEPCDGLLPTFIPSRSQWP